jgi:DNA repair exonuclease SbcCD ATPase subunit
MTIESARLRLHRAVAESQRLFDAGHVEAAITTLEKERDAAPEALELPERIQRLKWIAAMGPPVAAAGAERIRQGYEAARERVRVLQDQLRRHTGQQSGGASDDIMATLEKLQGSRALARSLRKRLTADP